MYYDIFSPSGGGNCSWMEKGTTTPPMAVSAPMGSPERRRQSPERQCTGTPTQDSPDLLCLLAGKLLTEKSHFPAALWQDKLLHLNHSIVLEAKGQVVNGFQGRWHFGIVASDHCLLSWRPEWSLLAALVHSNGGQRFNENYSILKTRVTSCVSSNTSRRWRGTASLSPKWVPTSPLRM